MKVKHITALVFAVIFIAGVPFSALASDNALEHNLGGSEVVCTVPEIYDFSVPEDAVIHYPQTYLYLGEFIVGDILLSSGEKLNLILTAGQLTKTGNEAIALRYNVVFNAPSNFDRTDAGISCGIAVTIDEDDFDNADKGTYTGELLFQVESTNYNDIVWQQTVSITAIRSKSAETSELQNETSQPDGNTISDDNEDFTYDEHGTDEVIPEEENNGADQSQGDLQTIGDEAISSTTIKENIINWIWIPAAFIALLLCTILILLFKNKKEEE